MRLSALAGSILVDAGEISQSNLCLHRGVASLFRDSISELLMFQAFQDPSNTSAHGRGLALWEVW